MATKKIKTQEILTNRNLSIDYSKWKKNIESKRYSYFDFNHEEIERIAKKNLQEVSNDEIRLLVQALFPEYLQCSGLFDAFLLFDVVDGERVDPPKYFYGNLRSYLNNDKEAKVNRLCDEIKELFQENEIECSEEWRKWLEG